MRSAGVSFMLLCLGVTSCQTPPADIGAGDGVYREGLAAAREQIAARRLHDAARRLTDLRRDFPVRPEASFWLAEIRYRQGDSTAAIALYDEHLRARPDWFPAYHRRWQALWVRGLGGAETRRQIEREIELLLERYPHRSAALLAAYHGHKVVRRHRRGRQVLMRLLTMPDRAVVAEQVAARLLEEALTVRDRAQRFALSGQFMEHFPDQRGLGLASAIYVAAAPQPWVPASAAQTEAQFPGNRQLKLFLARALLENGVTDALVAELLRAHRRELARAGPEAARYQDVAAWQTLRAWERASSAAWSGIWHLRRGDLTRARHWLQVALPAHPQPWRVYAGLAELAEREGNLPEALGRWRRSAEMGNPDPELEHHLNQLWRLRYGPVQSARREIARAEAVPLFSNVTSSTGLAGVRAQRVAWGDYNGDGYPDLLLDGRVFANRQGQDFVEVTATLGIEAPGATGGSWVDVDNDGRLDLFLTFKDQNSLWRNQGDEFIDITRAAFSEPFLGRTEAALWGDIDNDGWLDLYLANYERRELERGLCWPDRLYRNVNGSRFLHYSSQAGTVTDEPLCGRGGLWADVDGDGRQDILVANYRLDPNLLWLNRGGRFVDAAAATGLRGVNVGGAFGHSIGAALGDLNGDNRADIFVANLAHPRYLEYSDMSQLWLRDTPVGLSYRNAFDASGIAFEESAADPLLADFDNDGALDLFVTSIYAGRYGHFYQNDGRAGFRDISWLAGVRVANAWGAAATDFDGDGDVDLLTASRDGVNLFRNEGNANHWLGVRLALDDCNRFGVGSLVFVTTPAGSQSRQLQVSRGTGSQDGYLLHFGLGDYAGPVTVTLRTLCGGEYRRRLVAVDRIVTLP